MLSNRMGLHKYLMGRLSKVVDNASHNSSLLCVGDAIQVCRATVREMMEDVEILYRRLASLLESEDEINPLVQILTHVGTLKRLSVLGDEDPRVTLGPWGKLNVIDLNAVAFAVTKVVAIDVGQEFGKTVELGDKFSHVSLVLARGRLPCFWDGLEETICVIKASSLKQNVGLNEGR